MNKDEMFLSHLAALLDKGYPVNDVLTICSQLNDHPAIDEIRSKLILGIPFEEALLTVKLPSLFKEFFAFFVQKHNLSNAIRQSLNICQLLNEHKRRLIKELSYPFLLLIFILCFSLFATIVLFPRVDQLFISFDVKLSLMVQILFMIIRLIPVIIIIVVVLIISIIVDILYSLKRHRFKRLDHYMRYHPFKWLLQKYFTLKFCIYFNELLKDHIDANTIVVLLNEKMMSSDLKMIVYELYRLIIDGYSFIDIIGDFDYIDPLFTSMYLMYLNHPDDIDAMNGYIDMTYELINQLITRAIKIITPAVYGFVAFFVIAVYLGIILPMMNIVSEI